MVENFLGRPLDGGLYPYVWLAFLRSLHARGPSGEELAVSDAHQGLKNAIATVFAGIGWQRCRTHVMANLLTRVPRRCQPGVATPKDLFARYVPSTGNFPPCRGCGGYLPQPFGRFQRQLGGEEKWRPSRMLQCVPVRLCV